MEERTAELKRMNEQLWFEIAERKKAKEELREAELRYRTVADFTNDWEYWETPEGKLRYVSPSCERITGYKAEHFIENPGLISEITLPEDNTIPGRVIIMMLLIHLAIGILYSASGDETGRYAGLNMSANR